VLSVPVSGLKSVKVISEKFYNFDFIPNIGTFNKKNAMAKNTSILLGEHFEEFISGKISSGKYNSASEVIHTALRLLETEEQKMKDLNKALVQGEKSGFEKNFNPKSNLKKLHSKFL
jgi:antitoxin ParD1/3/4